MAEFRKILLNAMAQVFPLLKLFSNLEDQFLKNFSPPDWNPQKQSPGEILDKFGVWGVFECCEGKKGSQPWGLGPWAWVHLINCGNCHHFQGRSSQIANVLCFPFQSGAWMSRIARLEPRITRVGLIASESNRS